jgi:hypothetical protein
MVLASVTLPELEDLARQALGASDGLAVRAMAQELVARAGATRVG